MKEALGSPVKYTQIKAVQLVFYNSLLQLPLRWTDCHSPVHKVHRF